DLAPPAPQLVAFAPLLGQHLSQPLSVDRPDLLARHRQSRATPVGRRDPLTTTDRAVDVRAAIPVDDGHRLLHLRGGRPCPSGADPRDWDAPGWTIGDSTGPS